MSESDFDTFDPQRDGAAVHRIFREAGWVAEDTTALDTHIACADCTVSRLDGEAECFVATNSGTIRYLREDLPLQVVAAVLTSRIARKQGIAGRLTARAIAEDARRGAAVSALGMFEQGFYDRLGYGTGPYVNRVALVPGELKVPGTRRVPRRLSAEDYELVHRSRLNRRRVHGSCNIDAADFTHADMLERATQGGFGLGFCDEQTGELTHHVVLNPKGSIEHGPYFEDWMAWQTRDQFLELMGVIRNLGDQVPLIYVREACGVQLQDLTSRPIHQRLTLDGSRYDGRMRSIAYWQFRINDLPRCIEQIRLPGVDVRFNLNLIDPIESYLPPQAPWRGVGGEYVVEIGRESKAHPGLDGSLVTMEATVNAFSRLWLGVRSPSALAMTDDVSAPPALLDELDFALRLPAPSSDWDF